MQHLLWITLFITCVTSTFIHATRAHEMAAQAKAKLQDTEATSTSASASSSGGLNSGSYLGNDFTTLKTNLFSFFNIEGAGAYSILGFNGAKVTYPPVLPGNGLVSSSSFAIDPPNKRLVFNQGESGNQYVFNNGTYITLNQSTAANPNAPFLCTYLPYVNYTQEVLGVNNITLQDIFYQPAPQNAPSTNNWGYNYGSGYSNWEQVKIYSGIMVDASSCGTMISFSVASTQGGHIRGIYAAEPFPFTQFGTPTGAAVVSSALIFDDSTIQSGTHPGFQAFFQLPSVCFQPNLVNYCAATGFGAPPTPVCNLFPPIH